MNTPIEFAPPRPLSFDEKCYLSRFFVTKDRFDVEPSRGDAYGLFIVYGANPLANLEKILSIKEFLAEQNSDGNTRSSYMYWTKNNRQHVDNVVFKYKNKEHFTNLTDIQNIASRGAVRGNGFLYMDELSGGRDLMLASKILRRNLTVFMSVVSDNLEDALSKISSIRPQDNMCDLNFGSMPSESNESKHLF